VDLAQTGAQKAHIAEKIAESLPFLAGSLQPETALPRNVVPRSGMTPTRGCIC
jgi:hypothetical protein